MSNSSTTPVPEKLDFVSFAQSLGYISPMYLPQETKTLLSEAMKFAKSYGDRRELEGRVDEHRNFLTELVLSDATRPEEELATEFVQRSRDRYKYLESQKEKN